MFIQSVFFADINDPVIQKRADVIKIPLITPMYFVGSTETIIKTTVKKIIQMLFLLLLVRVTYAKGKQSSC